MTDNSIDIGFRHILVALDSSGHSLSALEAAAQLAKISEAELQGLFVHDEIWYRISRIPAVREISEITGESRELPEEYIQKQIRLLEGRIRRQLKNISRKYGIEHSWNSARGTIIEELLKAAEKTDLVTIGRSGHSHSRAFKIGRTARAVLKETGKPVLLLEEGVKLDEGVIVVYDGTPEGKRSLELGLRLARINNDELRVLGLANRSEALQDRNREIEEKVQNANIRVRLHLLVQDDLWNVTRAINKVRGGLLIIPKNQPLVQGEWVGRIFQMANCPLLLMN